MKLPAVKKSAEVSAYLDSKGRSKGKIDVLIAGIILANGYNEILTKNVGDYKDIHELEIHSY